MKIYGITYGSNRYENRCKVLTEKAKKSELFNNFEYLTENDLNDRFKHIFGKILSFPRGGGYWIWKAYIIFNKLITLEENDILFYLDAGCDLNINPESTKRFNEYIEMVTKSECGLLRFELPELYERDYTNKKTFEYFQNKYDRLNITDDIYNNKYQLMATVFIMRKTKFVMDFFQIVLSILCDNPILFTDIYNENIINHRHDQSVMSLLYRHMGGNLIIPDETYFKDGFNSEESKKYPIWATRQT
jgi:hypothetical protein